MAFILTHQKVKRLNQKRADNSNKQRTTPMNYRAIASKGGDQAIIITGGQEPLIIPTQFESLSDLQAMAREINSILSIVTPKPSWMPSNEELDEIEAMPDMLPDEDDVPGEIPDFPTNWDGPELS